MSGGHERLYHTKWGKWESVTLEKNTAVWRKNEKFTSLMEQSKANSIVTKHLDVVTLVSS